MVWCRHFHSDSVLGLRSVCAVPLQHLGDVNSYNTTWFQVPYKRILLQAGVYTRPRKKTSMADSSPLMLLKQSSSSKRKFGGESGTESVPSPSQRIKLSEESEGEVAGGL